VVRKLVTLESSVLGAVCDLLEKLSDPEWVTALKRFLRKENPWGEVTKLLKRVTSVNVGGFQRFVAKDHLESANVGYTNDNFNQFFLNKVEENVGGITIAVHRLKRNSLDFPILSELSDHAKISLAYFFELLKKQSKGKPGPLLTNGCANIAYIMSDGKLWAVQARWVEVDRYWHVYARSVEDPAWWDEDSQVLSRDS